MRTVNIDVVLRQYTAESLVEAMSSVTLVQSDDDITIDEVLIEYAPERVIVVISHSEPVNESAWSDAEVFDTAVAVLQTLIGVVGVWVAVLQLVSSL
jgi:sulfur carrier protein ThiS